MKRFEVMTGVFLILALGAANALSSPDIRVSVLKYDPAPAEPGKFLDVWLNIDNKGTGSVADYVLEVVPGYPFFLDTNENAIREFSFIGSDGARVEYKLRVAEDAPNGNAVLKLKRYAKGSAAYDTQQLNISVLGKVYVDITSAEPGTLIPGNPTGVKLLFNNSGTAPVRDLIVSWTDPDKKILPFAGENRRRISQLGIGEATDVEFSMIADPSITQGVHLINVNMTFQRFGTTDSRISQIAFIVGGLTRFDVAQQDVSGNAVSLSVADIGVNTATGVMISVPEQPGWKIIGSSNVFLGNLNPGDFTVASFQLQPLSKEPTQALDVRIEYTDTTGIRQGANSSIQINLLQAAQQKTEKPSILPYVIAVIAIAALWYANKRFKILKNLRA